MATSPRPVWRTPLAVASLLASSIIAAAQQPAEKQPAATLPPTPPAKAPPSLEEPPEPYIPLRMLSVPDDFDVSIWSQTPMFRQPSNMDVDIDGRVWVTEAYNYRRHKGRDPQGDRVVILEDTDGDGKADKSSVFVQDPELLAPLGIAVIDNRIYVSNTPNLIVYTDVNRDRKFDPAVDKREVLLTGFDGANHDHSLHAVTQGPDGKLYFNHGNSGALFTDKSGRTFRTGSFYDPAKSGGGIAINERRPPDFSGEASDDGHIYVGGTAYRMNVDGTMVEPIGFNFRNSYEQTVTSFGDVFNNDNDDPPASRTSFLMEYGNLGFTSRDGKRQWRADMRPGQNIATAEWRQDDPGVIPAGDVYGNGAPTGIVFYEGDALGEKWRGLLLSCETSRNVVFGYKPELDGAGYKLERMQFLTTNKEQELAGIDGMRGRIAAESLKTWFRPSDVAIGTDGSIYVADWFDPRTGGHSALDKTFSGTIYRITPKGKKLTAPKIDPKTVEGQIAALKNPAVNVRAIGFNALKAAGAASVAPVSALLSDKNPYIRGRAIFLLAHLGPQGIAKVEEQLKSPDAMTRIAAFRALRRAHDPRSTDSALPNKILTHARTLAIDSSPAVRREVALAMRDVPLAQSKDILLTLAKGYDGKDRAYLEAWGIGCAKKEAEIYAALAASAPGTDATKWPATYANLIWRLTPKGAESAFATRALAPNLGDRDRLAAVTALGFIKTVESANALIDIVQKGAGMVKSHAMWWLLNYKDLNWKDAGIDAALKERNIYNPDTVEVAPIIVPEPAPTKLPAAAEIAKLNGDAKKGSTTAQACLLCHRIGDKGTDFGPALTGWARGQSLEVVINSIVNPSADIAHGFDGSEVNLRDGGKVHGIVLSSGDPLVVASQGGLTQMIPASKLRGRPQSLGRSLMLSADQLGLSAQDVADIAAYLKTQ
jgi:putative membrane-bound dehydrogenase-like protein